MPRPGGKKKKQALLDDDDAAGVDKAGFGFGLNKEYAKRFEVGSLPTCAALGPKFPSATFN